MSVGTVEKQEGGDDGNRDPDCHRDAQTDKLSAHNAVHDQPASEQPCHSRYQNEYCPKDSAHELALLRCYASYAALSLASIPFSFPVQVRDFLLSI